MNSGILHENLTWMLNKATKVKDSTGTFNGMLLMDEMSIQEDLQFVKKGRDWEIIGTVDTGDLVNDLDDITEKKRQEENSNGLALFLVHVCWLKLFLLASGILQHK